MAWQPITDLPDNWRDLQRVDLHALAGVWQEQRAILSEKRSYGEFLNRLRRQIAIETGIIERLYTLDRGVTRLLIEQGIDLSLIPQGATDKPPMQIITQVRDHEQAIDHVFDVIANQRPLSVSFIKQLHQLLTRHQDTVEAVDQFGQRGQTPLIKGDWKQQPNNPQRGDGSVHEYCPPDHVAAEMDRLVQMHLAHLTQGVPAEVEAAWLHHRFTHIHPFQDDNGRVARNLATLVFLQAGWFPLAVLRFDSDEALDRAREQYIHALEQADAGDLQPLINFFCAEQRRAFVRALSLSEQVLDGEPISGGSYKAVIDTLGDVIRDKRSRSQFAALERAETTADGLFDRTVEAVQVVKVDVRDKLNAVDPAIRVGNGFALQQDEKVGYYRAQIIEIAKQQQYFANLGSYKRWARLTVRSYHQQIELLWSFHVLGTTPTGVMVVSAMGWQRDSTKKGQYYDLQSLTHEPFTFSYKEALPQVAARFEPWLQETLIYAATYIRNSLE